jgi:hypothetical protein
VRSRGTSFADTRLIPRSYVSVAWHVPNDKLSSSAISLIVKRRFLRITALTTVSLVRTVDGRPVCGSSTMDVRPFLNREYHSNVLDRLNAVSPNACCSISYVSVAVLPNFWQNLMQTRCSFNTSISQYDGEQIRLHCRSTHSRLSQAAIRSSGMWRQEMLPSILHGCHFDTISSFSTKKFVPDIFDQTSYVPPQPRLHLSLPESPPSELNLNVFLIVRTAHSSSQA